jgi:hypothetical protein
VGLLIVAGAGLPEATAATLLVRAATLWWAVLLGILALMGLDGGDAAATPDQPGDVGA